MSAPSVPTTENCRFCWMCRHVCPVGHVTARETYTPHAWALTIESVKRGQLQWDRESTAVLYACADCGLCRRHCVTDQPLPDAIASARAAVVAAGLAPEAVTALDRRLRATLRAASRPAPSDRVSSPSALFIGDAPFDPRSLDAVEQLLAAAGVEADRVGVGCSTGATAASLGLRETAAALADRVIAEIVGHGASEVLVLTPADRWTFEHVYPHRLGTRWPGTVRVREVVSVVSEALAGGRLSFTPRHDAGAYAYHDPCHAPRLDRDRRAPRSLLAAAAGHAPRELFWREARAHPCGAIGGLDLTHPAIAAQLADARLADAAATGAAALVTEDPVCLHHLRSRGRSLEVVDLYTLLARQIA